MFNKLQSLLLTESMLGHIENSQMKEFFQKLTTLNFERSKKLNYILFLASIVLLFTDYLNLQKGLWITIPGYKYLFYAHLLLLLEMLILLPFFLIYRDLSPKQLQGKRVIVLLLAYFITSNCALTSIVDQSIHGEITVFIIGALTMAVMNYFKPLTSLGIYLINYLIFLIGITLMQKNPAILRAHYINGAILVLVACPLCQNSCHRTPRKV